MGHSKANPTQTLIPDNPQDVKQGVVAEAEVGEVKAAELKAAELQQGNGKPNVYQRWNAVLAEVKSVAKLGENKVGEGYDYLQATDIIKELRPLFAKHGLVLKSNPIVDKTDDSEYESRSKATMHFVRIFTEHWLINCDDPDDRVELLGIGDAADVSDKALNKARTGALKYVLRDNFLIDGQDVAEAERDTKERSGRQNKVGQQGRTQEYASQAEPPMQVRSQKFIGSVVECGAGESEDSSPYMWFVLHDRTDKMYTFRQEDFQWIKDSNRLVVTCQEKQGRNGKLYWQVTHLDAPITPDFAAGYERGLNTESKPSLVKSAPQETVQQILKRMFPEQKDYKRKRLTEGILEDQPEALRVKILQSFERRLNSEKPSSDTGMISCLDVSIVAVTEEAGELFPVEGAAQ